jgi:hypothetical protein
LGILTRGLGVDCAARIYPSKKLWVYQRGKVEPRRGRSIRYAAGWRTLAAIIAVTFNTNHSALIVCIRLSFMARAALREFASGNRFVPVFLSVRLSLGSVPYSITSPTPQRLRFSLNRFNCENAKDRKATGGRPNPLPAKAVGFGTNYARR